MKTILVAVNAKYIHTNPAVRGISVLTRRKGHDTVIVETTVNDHVRQLLDKLYMENAAIYIFSCYIWNIEFIGRIASDLKKLLPSAVLAAAGPQVSFHPESFLSSNPFFDIVLAGEGEESTPELIGRLKSGTDLSGCPGVTYRRGGSIIRGPSAGPVDMNSLPFPYEDIAGLAGRILYYESMRGCPFSCSYCLSSAEKGVRYRSLPLVYADLDIFLEAGVMQVKFVDRTFNCSKERAMSIWKYLCDHDNSVTNFHFELAGDLLDSEMLGFLSGVRKGLFQFEIGVQSCNERTLEEINRPVSFEKLSENVKRIISVGNIHVHLDLIAGLPYEDYESFTKSFDMVHALRPNQLQLGFLKVLPGSAMEVKAREYGLVFSDNAPFEVLGTSWIRYSELSELRGISNMVEIYNNSGRFSHIISYIMGYFPSSFECYKTLWLFYAEKMPDRTNIAKITYYDILEDFMYDNNIPVTDTARWLCKYDVLCVEKPRKLPAWADLDISRDYYAGILELLGDEDIQRNVIPLYYGMEPKHINRIVHVEIFPLNPETLENAPTAVLFDYRAGKRYLFDIVDGPISRYNYRIED